METQIAEPEVKTEVLIPPVDVSALDNVEGVSKETIAEIKTEILEKAAPAATIPFTPPVAKTEPVAEEKPIAVRPEMDAKLPFETRILSFLESRGRGEFVKMNDFLKFLYPVPLKNEPPVWTRQETNKSLKGLLNKMQEAGKLIINNNQHHRLGTFYYAGDNPVTQYYNISNVIIEAKLP